MKRGRKALEGLAHDLRDHIARQTEENIARGMSPEEARRQALITLGNPTLIEEDTHAVWAWRWLEDLRRDLAYAWRSLRRSPSFAIVAVLTLGLGAGAVSVVTSVVYGVLYRPLPFANADRLVRIVQVIGLNGQQSRAGLRPEQIASWQANSRTLTIGYFQWAYATLTDVPSPVRLAGASVTPGLFRGIAGPPEEGRLLTDDDAQSGNTRVILLAERIWRSAFDADPTVVGRTIVLNLNESGSQTYRVIGIMPDGFGFPSLAAPGLTDSTGALENAPEFWVPLPALEPSPERDAGGFTIVGPTFGLLRPGVTLAQATAEANTLLPLQPSRRFPIQLVSARVEQARAIRPLLLIFESAVAFVLFIACANLTNLLLARAAHRQRELAVRLSLGAGRGRIVRQALAEGLVVGFAGAIVAGLIAAGAMAWFRTLPPYLLPRMREIHLDTATLVFALAVSIGAAALVSVATVVWQSSRDVTEFLRGSASATLAKARRAPLRALVVGEVTAGLVLVAGASLLLLSLVRLNGVDPGFDPQEVFSFRVTLPADRYADDSAGAFVRRLGEALQALPETAAVSVGDSPLGWDSTGFSPGIDGRTARGVVKFRSVAPGFFVTLGVRMRRGRGFAVADTSATPHVAVVNETFARRYFPASDPIGHRVSLESWNDLDIIGVASDMRTARPNAPVEAELYVPINAASADWRSLVVFIRTRGAAPDIAGETRATVRRLDPQLVVYQASNVETQIRRTYADARVYSRSSTTFASLALALAAIGIYGVLAFTVGARTRELGIRIAVGANTRRLVWLVLHEAFATVLLGVGFGVGAACYLSRFLQNWLYGVTPQDPAILAGVAMLFLLVGGLAAYVPARRATRVDPIVALRTE